MKAAATIHPNVYMCEFIFATIAANRTSQVAGQLSFTQLAALYISLFQRKHKLWA